MLLWRNLGVTDRSQLAGPHALREARPQTHCGTGNKEPRMEIGSSPAESSAALACISVNMNGIMFWPDQDRSIGSLNY